MITRNQRGWVIALAQLLPDSETAPPQPEDRYQPAPSPDGRVEVIRHDPKAPTRWPTRPSWRLPGCSGARQLGSGSTLKEQSMARNIRITRKLSAPGQAVVSAASERALDVLSEREREVVEHAQVSTARKRHTPGQAVVRVPRGPLKLLTLRQAAEYAKVSIQTVRRWIEAGELKAYRAGRQIRIDESDLIRSLSAR
jgi:excisionase family DNA binding protein